MTIETLFIIAALFLMLELIVASMGALGFIAFGAYIYGVFIMHSTGLSDFYGLSFGAVVAIGLSIFGLFAIGGYFTFKAFRKKISVGIESMLGNTATVTQWTGKTGKIEYEGEDWRATSTDTFVTGDIGIITGYKNMTLTIKKGN